jgi:holo-[acyl-carrier protein] synthase
MRYATQYQLIEVARVTALCQRYPRVITRLFTASEVCYCEKHRRNPFQYYAARLAAKLAARKLLGQGRLAEIEVFHGPLGRPLLDLHGKAAQAAEGKILMVSLSHEGDHAAAIVSVECVQ